ncbi:cytochrome P450 302a1, mitochondrial [Cephus cinctus]|uniref:Cytochrome P450 302a1, mitochondrial n=1 Tax=Cephus cinctus TaxID=211228 RepID=A0AAJ7C9X8_CEPCN|nr:cytochrome P450 302a1, mitochondrial [Cephus cinctus]
MLSVLKKCLKSLQRSVTNQKRVNKLSPRPFEDIPGPKSLPFIGTLYKYIPWVGEYNFERLHKNGAKKLARYGPLVREEIVPGVHLVWIFRPEDIAEIFRAEMNLHPERRSHLALAKYRKDRPHIYNSGGLLPTNGPEWWRLRKELQKAISRPQNVKNYLEDTDMVVKQFLKICTREKFDNFLPLLSRLYLELTCLVAFDVKLNSFSEVEMLEGSRSSKLIEAALSTNKAILALDNGLRLWRFFNTPLYRKLCKAQNCMEEVAIEMVSRKIKGMNQIPSGDTESLLEIYLKNPALDEKDVVGMACDMLLAGIDTTTYTTAFALYHLANNPRTQEVLYKESKKLLENPEDPVTATVLGKASYTKAIIKETLRLNPISVGVGRILQNDVILNGYQVPKGTVVVTQNQVICRLEEYFENSQSFIPERWIREECRKEDQEKSSSNSKTVHPYLLLPFGHGPRSCIARRLAEQNIQVTLLRICRELKFTWEGKILDSKSLLINKPDSAVKLNFLRRD